MYCHHCGASNRDEASFCKKCGAKLVKPAARPEEKPATQQVVVTAVSKSEPNKKTEYNLPKITIRPILKKFQAKHYAAALVVILVVFAFTLSPVAKAYYGYYKGMRAANKSFVSNNYSDAVKQLQAISQHGLLKSYKNSLSQTLVKYTAVKNEDDSFQLAKQDEQSGNLDDAKKLLTEITNKNDYPKLADVTKELNKVDDAITAKIQSDANAKVAVAQQQAQQAASDAQAAAASKKKAEAAAAQAAAQAAQNQAAAQAAQDQAAAAAQEAQDQAAAAAQANQQKTIQVEISFVNQLSSAYKSVNQAFNTNYSSGIQYSNSGNDLLAISEMGNVQSVLTSALNTTSNLSSFTNMPADYYAAAQNMLSAMNALSNAADLVVQESGTSLDYSSTINSDKNSYLGYMNQVYSFLSAH